MSPELVAILIMGAFLGGMKLTLCVVMVAWLLQFERRTDQEEEAFNRRMNRQEERANQPGQPTSPA